MDRDTKAFLRRVGLNERSSTAQVLAEHRRLSVDAFVGEFRRGSIRRQIPSEFLNVTVEDALLSRNSTVRKLLTDERYVRR
jgi:hypothetical protein